MKSILVLAAALAGFAAAADVKAPAVDTKALAPILAHSWSPEACDTADAIRDWVIDTDGTPFERWGGGFTPLTQLTFKDGMLSETDEVGLGSATSVFKLQADGTLRLWSLTETSEDASEPPPEPSIKDGKQLISDDGEKLATPEDTPAMKPCPPRQALFSAEASAALDGSWGEAGGSACGKGTAAMTIDLKQPIPKLSFGQGGGQAASDYWVLQVQKTDASWDVTAGSALEASLYRLTPGQDDTLVRTDDGAETKPVSYKRCPR